jgi:hypothetical protein
MSEATDYPVGAFFFEQSGSVQRDCWVLRSALRVPHCGTSSPMLVVVILHSVELTQMKACRYYHFQFASRSVVN